MTRIAILASGAGTNAENLINYFRENEQVNFSCIISNRADAGVHSRAEKLGVKSLTFDKKTLESAEFLTFLKNEKIDLIILAGFLLKIPQALIAEFPNKIVNIHPSLLPKFGGKGMYGHHVHEAVIKAGEKFSGITVHFVNEEYDRGEIILQAQCEVSPTDTPDSLAEKVHALEYEFFPKAIEKIL